MHVANDIQRVAKSRDTCGRVAAWAYSPPGFSCSENVHPQGCTRRVKGVHPEGAR